MLSKKLIATLALVAFTKLGFSQEIIQVVWPYSVSTTAPTLVKEVIETANNNQSAYKFIFVNKQGAGGAIAAKYVLENKAILAISSSFFVLPDLMPEAKIDVDKYKIIQELCSNRPLAVFSKKYAYLKKDMTIAIPPGGMANLVSGALKTSGYSVLEIPYKTATEVRMAVLSDIVDYDINWLSANTDIDYPISYGHVIGITGTRVIGQFKPLNIPGTENILAGLYFITGKNLPKSSEVAAILNNSYTQKAADFCIKDFGTVPKPKNLDIEFDRQKALWSTK